MSVFPKFFAWPAQSVLVLGVLAVLTAGCDDKKKQAGMPPPNKTEVTVVSVLPQRVPLYAELPGRTSAYRVAEVRPQVNGIIQKRLFEEGSDVKAGQQLYQIDPAPYQASLQSAMADLAKARANLKSVAAKAQRYADLVQINAVSHQDYDDIVATLDQDKAQIQVAQAAVETARINVNYTKVYSPIGGRIGKSMVTEGALVTANQTTALATVTQLDPIYVDVTQSSSDLLRLRSAVEAGTVHHADIDHTPVTLTLDGSSEAYDQTGQLQFSDVTVDPTTGSVQLRAVFPNPNHRLYPGLFVRARVEQGMKDQALLVPQQALVRSADGATSVWVVGDDDKANPRSLEVGQALGDKWVVNSGLKPGERVIVEGVQKVRPRVLVTPVTAPAPPSPDRAKP